MIQYLIKSQDDRYLFLKGEDDEMKNKRQERDYCKV